jgi:hypothetical protein
VTAPLSWREGLSGVADQIACMEYIASFTVYIVIDHAHLLVRSNPKLLGGLFSLAKAARRSICILLISNSYLR